MNLEASSFDAASTSQGRLKDLGGLKEEQCCMRKKKIQKKLMILNLSHGISSLLLKLMKLVGNHLQEKQQNPFLQHFRKIQQDSEATWNNCLQLSIHNNQFTNAVFSKVWDIYGKYHDESMGDLDVHLAIWRMFMYTTLQALISLISIGKEYDEISFGSKKMFISRQITDSGTNDLQYYTRTTNLENLFGEVKKKTKYVNYQKFLVQEDRKLLV